VSQETKKFNILLKASTAFPVFESETHLRRTILKDRLTKRAVCQRDRNASEKNINLKFLGNTNRSNEMRKTIYQDNILRQNNIKTWTANI